MQSSKAFPVWLALSIALCIPSVARSGDPLKTVKIPDATLVRLSLQDSLTSATNKVDDPVHFEVTEDVKVGDLVVIPKGSTASGHVVEAQPKKSFGRGGKLNFTVDYVKAPDGTNVRLRASSARKGEDVSDSLLLTPFFLIMRGKDVNIPRGAKFNAYVDGDREITLDGPTSASESPSSVQAPPAATPATAEEPSTVVVKSTPDGADITVDGKYVGSTPSTLRLAPGEHSVVIERPGYRQWQRTMSVTPGGIVTVDANLERQ